MSKKEKILIILIILFFAIDGLYWYGYYNLIDIFVDNPLFWILTPSLGFIFLYTFNKGSLKYKIIFNILITIGALFNAGLFLLWYLFKDFGF